MDIYDAYKLQTPASIILAGPSGSGKTTLIEQILSRLNEVFDRTPTQVIVCYARDQNLYNQMKKASSVPIEFIKGIPNNLKPKARTLIIFDDLQDEFGQIITSYFIKHSHHSDCDIILICQNLFAKSPHLRTCSLNTGAIIKMKDPRDSSQINFLARQICPFNPSFLISAYKQATQKPHSYIYINLKQQTDDSYRYRDSIFPKEANYYVDKKLYSALELNS